MVKAEPFEIRRLCDNDAYCMSKYVWTPACIRTLVMTRKEQQLVQIEKKASNSTGSLCCVCDMIYEIYMEVFVGRSLLCSY